MWEGVDEVPYSKMGFGLNGFKCRVKGRDEGILGMSTSRVIYVDKDCAETQRGANIHMGSVTKVLP